MNENTTGTVGSVTGEISGGTDPVAELIQTLQGGDSEKRTQAWFECGPLGATAIPRLVALWGDADAGLEVQRAARNAVFQIVRFSSRPETGKSRIRVTMELNRLVEANGPAQIRRELLWLLSEIAGDESLPALSRLLAQTAVREEACMALERIPGKRSLKILESSLRQSPVDFKPVLAAALARRGHKPSGVDSPRLAPRAQTKDQPLPQT
jgi:hypothetical protein